MPAAVLSMMTVSAVMTGIVGSVVLVQPGFLTIWVGARLIRL
jgi:hypothetical protein